MKNANTVNIIFLGHFSMCSSDKNLSKRKAILAFFAENGETDRFDANPMGDIWLVEGFHTRKILKISGFVEMAISGGRTENSSDLDWRNSEPVLAILTKKDLQIWKGQFPFFESRNKV